MWNKLISFFDSLIIHFFLLVILFLSLTLPEMNSPAPQNSVLDEKQVQAEIERLKREQAFESLTQESQQYALKQNKTDYEQLMEQEALHLEVLRQQQEVEKQELEVIMQRRLDEKVVLETLLREKEALEGK